MQNVRYYDLRHVRGETTHIDIDNGVIESAGISFFDKAILRALGPRGWGAITIDNFSSRSRKDLDDLVADALGLAVITEEAVELAEAPRSPIPVPTRQGEDPESIPLEEKTALLREIETAARLPEIASTRGNYSERREIVAFRDSEGHATSSDITRCGFSILAVAQRQGLIQMGRESRFAVTGFNLRHQQDLGRKAAETAVALLDAKPVRGGRMRTLIDQELAGVFAHEAIGHASEGDLVREGSSVLRDRIGEKIGNPQLTIVDDPSIPEFGFEPIDAEGVSVRRTEIIREGILNAYMHNRETLAALGNGIPGHARAMPGEVPLVRMSNTFIENGDTTFEELLELCGNGVLLKGSRGGQVDPGRGVFQFNAEYGYLIEGGECTRMVRDVSLTGEILSTLHSIVQIGNDRKMHHGYCGKGGQSVPVSDGAPHLLLEDAVVGGSGLD
jgi:TldD protein